MPWLLLLASYLLGAIPAAYVAGRALRGIDLREHGSGNLGATNAFRVLGAGIAAPVMAFDLLKGFVPAFVFPGLLLEGGWEWGMIFGVAAIAGHVFPVYLGFRGGKGVATGAGVFLALAPAAAGLAVGVWLLVLALGRMVSLASIVAAAALIAALPLTGTPIAVQLTGFLVGGFVIFAHRGNIARIARGQEPRLGRRAPAPEGEGR
jgi:acyl phosphate:glycerol-3-phosphate acyltransferase